MPEGAEGAQADWRTPIWGRYEVELRAGAERRDPVREARVTARITSPSGGTSEVEGFWDGGRTWRARFSPDELGRWSWETVSDEQGLGGRRGELECVPYEGASPLFGHGELRASRDGTHLEHADGTPFFWLACTAWNGALLSDERAWRTYLVDRAMKGFTAIQFVTTQWRAAETDREGMVAFRGREKIEIVPEFFRRLDRKLDEVNGAGLVAAPVLLWAIADRTGRNPGHVLPEGEAALLARYMVARYGAHQVVWILAGDGDYKGEKAGRWRRIGRAVFGEGRERRPPPPAYSAEAAASAAKAGRLRRAAPSVAPRREGGRRRLVTMHPCGQSWVADEFRDEPWFDLIGYQSGHGESDAELRWLTSGPPAKEGGEGRTLPVVNLEPNYEGHRAYRTGTLFDERLVRRAAYWSLLVSPTAGVTYGAHGIWYWSEEPAEPLDHAGTGVAPPWHEAMRLPGSVSMRHLRDLFGSVPWWRLRPRPDLLAEQPGEADPARFVAAAATEDIEAAVVYLPPAPGGGTAVREVSFRKEALPERMKASWFDPATGVWGEAFTLSRAQAGKLTSPVEGDAVLVLRSGRD
jgi:hypothetical protein